MAMNDIIKSGRTSILKYIQEQADQAESISDIPATPQEHGAFAFATDYWYICDNLQLILENVHGRVLLVSKDCLVSAAVRAFRYASLIDNYFCKFFIVQDEGEDAMWLLYLPPISEIIG